MHRTWFMQAHRASVNIEGLKPNPPRRDLTSRDRAARRRPQRYALAVALAVIALALWAPLNAATTDAADALPPAALVNASSLYLREAASGPVRWQPWNDATLALALKLDRPLLIDDGAVWCHWCHVMDQATYSDPEVATLINRNFVPIKIDADARPDIDGRYQKAASRLSGAAGWPLTAFAMPDGKLFLAFGYMPARGAAGRGEGGARGLDGMVAILQRVVDAYTKDHAALAKASARFSSELSQAAPAPAGSVSGNALLDEILAALANAYDKRGGGFGADGARFYDFPALELALAHGFMGHTAYTEMALASLDKIARGGVYDQLGGGFHRYSTDPNWRVPHFEKMAYDQAMGLAAYAQAYQASGDDRFKSVALGIAGYVDRVLLDPATHTFYSHQDADSFAGDDGSFYTWTRDEIVHGLASEQAKAALLYYSFDDQPALAPDGRVVLRRALTVEQLAARLKTSASKARALIGQASAAMVAIREHRRHPPVDKALLVDRNALMAEAYLAAAVALRQDDLKKTGLADIDFIRAHARETSGSFCHVWAESRVQVNGMLADQVYMLRALLAAYETTGSEAYLSDARALAAVVWSAFRDPASNLLRDRVSAQKDALPPADLGSGVFFDRPTPSPQAAMASALLMLAALEQDDRYAAQSKQLLEAAGARVSPQAGSLLGTFGLALQTQKHGEVTVVVVGSANDPATAALRTAALRTYRPGTAVVSIDPEAAHPPRVPAQAAAMLAASASHAPVAFVCAGATCASPISEPAGLARAVSQFGLAPAPARKPS